jgi:phosphoribosylanthranilate isomerase
MASPTEAAAPTGYPDRNIRTRIKICGVSREIDVEAAVMAGADAIGLVFYPKSPRHVSLARATELAGAVPRVRHAGRAVRQSDGGRCRCRLRRDSAGAAAVPWRRDAGVLRIVRSTVRSCHSSLDRGRFARLGAAAFACPGSSSSTPRSRDFGGGGKVFDWSLIPSDVPRPVVLSGGLHAGNVIQGIQAVRPWAVDVSSGVESSRGIKDAEKIRQFCEAVREADARRASAEA